MLMRKLGRSGLKVAALCLGGNTFGWTTDQKASEAVLDAYVEAGGNFIDTADVYSRWASGNKGGESETVLGAWMAARRIERTHERLQLNAWCVMAIADHSLAHLVDNFSRDFFVESVEEETENALSPGVFPSLALGPGQRFASKGSYVVRLADSGVEAVGGWVVP